MSYVGSYAVDDLLTFVVNTQAFATGTASDADSPPAYRVYENETPTPVLTGSMALLDGGNTDGFYSEQVALSAANGFEAGKCYSIYISATVGGVAGATHRTFQMQAVPTANQNADALLDRSDGVKSGLTPRNALRLIAAAAAGKLSGAATPTNVIRNAVADSKNRISATVDADGNRTAISYDLTT